MKEFFARIWQNEFRKNVLTVVSGTVMAQIVPLLATPFLTRIYTPHDYGVLGIFLGVSAIFNILSTFNFPTAIFVPKDTNDARMLFQLSIVIVILMSMLSSVVVFLLGKLLTSWVDFPELLQWVYFIPPVLFLYGLHFPLLVYLNRSKRYREISLSKVIASVMSIAVSITVGLLVSGPLGLFLGTLVNYIVLVSCLSFFTFRTDRALFSTLLKSSQIILYFKRYKNFPLYTLPSDFINIFVNQLPVFVLGKVSPSNVGHFNISNRILATPVQFVSVSISEIFRQRMSEEMHHTLDCSHTFRRLLKPMLLSFFPFLFIFILAPDLFAFLFGESWRSAGYFTRLMAPYFFFKFLAVPFCPLYSLAMRQREEFLLQFYLLASTLLIIYSGTSGFVDIHSMILLFSLNYSGVYLMNIIRTYSFSRQLGANYQ